MTDDRPTGSTEIEVDANASSPSDVDSIRSDLTSLSESIYSYVYENGRTYHAYRSGTYVLPNDEREQERLNMMHHVFRLCLDKNLCRTKLEHPQRILDIGTGTGIWAVDIADEFPSAEVTGVDLSPIQPGWIPPNLAFIIDDVTQEWSFQPESFDFIHMRCFAGSIEDWSAFLSRCYQYLKPGGRIEISETRAKINCDDGTFPEDSYLYKWEQEFNRIVEIQGRVWDIAPQIQDLLRGASFENVDMVEYVCPFGTWPKDPKLKEMGRYFRAQMVEGAMESYSLALFTRFGGWTPVEVQVLLAHLRAEVQSNKIHAYTHLAFATAQKPMAKSQEHNTLEKTA